MIVNVEFETATDKAAVPSLPEQELTHFVCCGELIEKGDIAYCGENVDALDWEQEAGHDLCELCAEREALYCDQKCPEILFKGKSLGGVGE